MFFFANNDEWYENRHNDNRGEGRFIPIICNVLDLYGFLYPIVYKSDDDPVCAEDKHRTDGDEGNKAKMNVVETAAKVNDAVDREKVDDIIKDNVKNETVFVNMPVE